ncbi:MAG: CheR family methyltransferase, partial [Ginsengibacter sp.]
IIIAREPATSEFSSMPSNVIATGIVDYILEPELMPAAIEYYVKNDGALLPQASTNKADEKIIEAIIDLIKERLPLDFSDYKQTTILRRIKRRAANHNFTRLESYLAFCKINKEEVEALAKDFLISVTSFFRDKEAFEFLQKNVIPEIIKEHIEGGEIKFWVAGCATGEEAYSLAILLKEKLTGKYKNYPVKIFATDIDTAALAFAGKGIYPESITKGVSPERIEKFFIKENNSYLVNPVIRKMIIFAQHDLVKNPPYCNMDFISCRNLLIYMTPPLQKKIYYMLHFGLKKGGYLFLGSSENAHPISSNVELLDKKWKIYKNIRTDRVIYSDPFSLPDFSLNKNKIINKTPEENYKATANNLTESVSQEIMKELGYMLVCVDDNYQVIKTFGDTTQYLLQKNFNLNLAELLPERLSVAFKTATGKALKLNEKVLVSGLKVKINRKIFYVRMLVKPIPARMPDQKLLMVLFSEDAVHNHTITPGEIYDDKSFFDEYTKNIESELKELKIELNNTNEKLDASNENLQSYNEELLSANEEMQSTNEEMQSVNEELHTINTDYELKNKELMEINDELNNYFRSNVNGQLYVNNDLLLMKFSPGTVKHINLLDTDIGRPITNISTNIKFETIENDIKEVIKHGGKINKEIEATNGKWYQLMTLPYIHQSDNKIHGAMITFNDITELKKIQFQLDKSNRNLLTINDDLDNFVHTASHDLLAPLANIVFSTAAMNEFEVTDPELKKLLNVINTSVKKFSSLIQDMTVIGKIETGMLVRENVDISEVINDIKLSIQDKIDTSKAVIKTDLQASEIHFSKKNFRSILYNLINNAIKFKNDKDAPVILISSGKKGDDFFISVKDNGIGIPEKDIKTIFAMHGRLHQDIEGQGMGLFLVKKIVDAAGGNIAVESEPGYGTTFTLYFKAEHEQKIELSSVNALINSPVNNTRSKKSTRGL